MKIELRNIHKSYGPTPVLQGISLVIEPNELFFLLGPSGCGKTTLLRMLAGFIAPDEGEILFDGKRVNDLAPEKRRVPMVFQSYALWPHLSVFENAAYGLRVQGLPEAEIRRQTLAVLDITRLEAFAERVPGQLSGGQQQRVAISRALAVNPSALLFDEPLSNLDARLRVEMRSELLAIHRRRPFTAVYVTHDQEEAMTMATRIGLLEQGKLHQVGLPQELYRQPVNRFVAEFMGPMNWLPSPLHATRDGNLLLLETPLGIFRAFPPQSVSGNLVVNSPLLAKEGLGEGGSRETGRRDVGSEGGPPVVPLVKGDNSSGQLNFQTCSQGSPSAGQKVLAGFRPSSVSFSPGSTDQTNTISCEILETQYAGDFQHLTVRPWMAQGKSADAQFQLMEPNPHRVRQRGERIEIGVAPEQVIVLKE